MWSFRCNELKQDNVKIYNDRCAYGFSPDMNLGVLLYTLKTRQLASYQQWLRWLDETVPTTKLCKKNGDDFDDCISVDWPRVCPEDMGHGQEAGPVSIFGRYGGHCALRPWDALDFSAVNGAIAVAPPPRLSKWEVDSRLMIKATQELLSAQVPLLRAPALVLLSSFDPDHYPLHLDAVRVLIRMMILNPSLELNNLPDLPDPADLVIGMLGPAASDGTDLASINTAARIIASRDPENPFYKLLADGPTPDVRSKIIERCPAIDDTPDGGHWIWEKKPGEEFGKKNHSMGWDCVFVGRLFNKMRVKKDIGDELLDRFSKYADPIDSILKQASTALQLAEAANVVAQQAFDAAQRELSKAQDFVNKTYAEQRQTLQKTVDDLTKKIADLGQQAGELEKHQVELANKIANEADTITEEYTEQAACGDVGRFVAPGACDLVKKTREIANPVKHNLLKEVSSLNDQLNDLRDHTIVSAQVELATASQAIVNLDKRLQIVREGLQKKTYEAAVSVTRAVLKSTSAALYEKRKDAANARRAYSRVKGNLAVWKKDRQALDDMASTEPPAPVEPPAPIETSTPIAPPVIKKEINPEVGEKAPVTSKQAALPPKTEAATRGPMRLRSQLADVRPTLNPPPWRVLPNSLWYVYRGEIGGERKCWLKGTLLTSAGGEAHAARVSIAPYSGPSLVLAAYTDLKILIASHPTLDIDGTKFSMGVSDDGKFMFLENSEMEAKAISLMKSKNSITIVATSQSGQIYKFASSLPGNAVDFSEALRLITRECKA
jgi:hypothetical protein